MITHPQVQPYSMTLIKTGIAHKKQITLNVSLIHLNTCVWILLIVFIDYSSYYNNRSQLPCSPIFWNKV